MSKHLLIFVLILATSTAFAQKFSIRGQVLDTTKSALPSATVMLLKAQDSTLVNFAASDRQGMFELKNVSHNDYILKITFVGYSTYTKRISAPESGDIEIGKITMQTKSQELDEVVVEADKAPVTIKRDTIEFNAESFKPKANDNVEGLLKKLPGVEVDNDGSITAQGEQVKKVTVDGREFFGRDPKLATRNLPADAVDKVQIFDKKSDQAEFTGIDDGQTEKTINLELKEEKRNGVFGNVTAGGGTDDRFSGKASLNKFRKGQQLSLLAMGNNTNEQGFSIDDYMNFTGGSQQMMGGGGVRLQFSSGGSNGGIPLNFGNRANGVMTNYAAGLNFNNDFSSKTKLNTSYFYNFLDHKIRQSTYRENFRDNGNFIFNQDAKQNNTNANHRINITLDHQIDSLNSLKLTSSVAYNETDSEQNTTSENLSPQGETLNTSNVFNVSSGNTLTSNNNLLLRHKFKKKGRTVSANLSLNVSQTDRDGLTQGQYDYFGDNAHTENQDQTSTQSIDNYTYGANVAYTEPLGGRKYLEVSYNFNQNLNDVDRKVFNLVNEQQVYDSALSNIYNSNYTYHRPGLNFRLNKSSYNFMVGTSVQYTNLKGDLVSLGDHIDRSFQNILPSLRFNYDFSNTKHLTFEYETSVNEPSIQQLNPNIDQSDRLNLYQGNPNLRPAYAQTWQLRFNTFNPVSFLGFFGNFNVNYTTNSITNSVTTNEQFVRTTRPVNVDYAMSMSGNATVTFPINKIKSRFSFGANARQSNSINLVDEEESEIRQRTLGGTFRYNYRYKEALDLSLSSTLSHQNTDYEFNQQDQTYFNQTYTADANLSFLKNYQLSGELQYLIYESKSTDFRQEIPLLNLSISRFLLKNKAGELKFSVNNLLDKALGVSQTANINYLERTTTNSLGRYFMVSFTYAINKHLNPMGGMRRGGGPIRIMREM